MMTHNDQQKAFTLIELSIVLVIIGLIVGGVLIGNDLIKAAQSRAQISQIEKFQTAVNTFKLKYNCIPGDCANASSFGFPARGSFAGQGDGNQNIEGIWAAGSGNNGGTYQGGGETGTFWVDLSLSNLIESSLSTATSTAAGTGAANLYFPSAKIGSGYVYVYNYLNANWFCAATATSVGSGNITGSAATNISVAQAFNIDSKIDDGLPITGNVIAALVGSGVQGAANIYFSAPLTNAAQPSGNIYSCYDNNNVNGAAQQYSMSVNNGSGKNCALSFRFQ